MASDPNLSAPADPTDPPVEPTDAQASSRRRAVIILAALVVIGIGMAGLTSMLEESSGTVGDAEVSQEGDAAGVPQRCDPSPDRTGGELGGLDVPQGPDTLVLGVMCAFDSDTSVPIADFLGSEPLVINFWATWCAPCRSEMPDFQRIHEASEGQFRLVGIDHQDAPGPARDFVEELGITYDLLRDPSGRYLPANGGFGMPTTLFVQPDGQIAFTQTGPMDAERFSELLAAHLDVDVTVPEA